MTQRRNGRSINLIAFIAGSVAVVLVVAGPPIPVLFVSMTAVVAGLGYILERRELQANSTLDIGANPTAEPTSDVPHERYASPFRTAPVGASASATTHEPVGNIASEAGIDGLTASGDEPIASAHAAQRWLAEGPVLGASPEREPAPRWSEPPTAFAAAERALDPAERAQDLDSTVKGSTVRAVSAGAEAAGVASSRRWVTHANAPVLIIDRTGTVADANEVAEAIFDRPVGRSLTDLEPMRPPSRAAYFDTTTHPFARALAGERVERVPVVIDTPKGLTVAFVKAHSLHDNSIAVVLSVVSQAPHGRPHRMTELATGATRP